MEKTVADVVNTYSKRQLRFVESMVTAALYPKDYSHEIDIGVLASMNKEQKNVLFLLVERACKESLKN